MAEEGKGEVRVNLCLTLTELGATGYKSFNVKRVPR